MRYALFSLPIVLAACAGPETVPTAALQADDFSDVNVEAIAACVRANATEFEKTMLSEGGEAGQAATRAVLSRPETGDCMVTSGVQLERTG